MTTEKLEPSAFWTALKLVLLVAVFSMLLRAVIADEHPAAVVGGFTLAALALTRTADPRRCAVVFGVCVTSLLWLVVAGERHIGDWHHEGRSAPAGLTLVALGTAFLVHLIGPLWRGLQPTLAGAVVAAVLGAGGVAFAAAAVVLFPSFDEAVVPGSPLATVSSLPDAGERADHVFPVGDHTLRVTVIGETISWGSDVSDRQDGAASGYGLLSFHVTRGLLFVTTDVEEGLFGIRSRRIVDLRTWPDLANDARVRRGLLGPLAPSPATLLFIVLLFAGGAVGLLRGLRARRRRELLAICADASVLGDGAVELADGTRVQTDATGHGPGKVGLVLDEPTLPTYRAESRPTGYIVCRDPDETRKRTVDRERVSLAHATVAFLAAAGLALTSVLW